MKTEYNFFAGWQNCEDWVSGGLGSTIEEALNDYLADHAEGEIDYAGLGDGDEFTVSIYSTINKDEATRRGMDEEWEDDWSFMLDEIVGQQKFRISINEGKIYFIPKN